MSTTTELPPPNLEQKIDSLILLVNEFRSSLEQRMDGLDQRLDRLEIDARERYVDLRQRIDTLDKRMERVEQRMYALDKNIDTYVREMLYVKDRVNDLEETRQLRN